MTKMPLLVFLGFFLFSGSQDLFAQHREGYLRARVAIDDSEDEEVKRARKLFVQGRELFAEKRYKEAIRAFESAYSFWKRREIQFNIALAYFQMGDEINAVTHLRRYLEECTPEERQTIPRQLMALQQKVGVLIVQMPSEDVEIWVNNRLEGRRRVEKVVRPGRMNVEIKVDNEVVAEKAIVVDEGTQKVWELAAIPTQRGSDETYGKGWQDGQVPETTVKTKKGLGRLHWAYFAVASALTVASGVAVTVTGVKTWQIKDQYLEEQTDELERKGERYKRATNALIGVTAATGVTAAVLAIFTKWRSVKREDESVSESKVTPMVGPGSVGFSLTW